ncbi:MAG: hypothetical protein QNJ40_04855 [Xanthomonadales bacterium]|nr:hypothetical protein [Xanthomonadales bacterium]
MDNRFKPDFHLGGPANKPGPLMTVMAVIAGIGMLVLAFFLGLVVLAVVAGLAVLASAILAVRRWWRRRKHPGGSQEPTTIEGEYTVVSVRKTDRDGQ